MKRFVLFLLSVCLLCCACGRGEILHRDREPEWPFSMTTALKLQVGDTAITADWTYGNGQSSFTLQTPQELSGVTVVCNAVESLVQLDGVQTDLPQQSAFVLLDRAYRALTDGMVEPQRTQEGWLYDGMDRYGFEALSEQDGSLQIRFPKADAEAVFTLTSVGTETE